MIIAAIPSTTGKQEIWEEKGKRGSALQRPPPPHTHTLRCCDINKHCAFPTRSAQVGEAGRKFLTKGRWVFCCTSLAGTD